MEISQSIRVKRVALVVAVVVLSGTTLSVEAQKKQGQNVEHKKQLDSVSYSVGVIFANDMFPDVETIKLFNLEMMGEGIEEARAFDIESDYFEYHCSKYQSELEISLSEDDKTDSEAAFYKNNQPRISRLNIEAYGYYASRVD